MEKVDPLDGGLATGSTVAVVIVNRADVAEQRVSEGDIAFARRRLGAAAGARGIGASVYVVPPGARQMPVHVHGDEEEIFFVVSGGGYSYEKGDFHAVRAGDTIVQHPNGKPHTFLAGEEGLELLAFSSPTATATSYLPRAKVMFIGPRWVPVDGPHPFRAEGLAGPLERPEVDPGAPRPGHIVALHDVELDYGVVRPVGRAAGSVKAGLNHFVVPPGPTGVPHHCHALEEELFVVLAGGGSARLGEEVHPLRAGDVLARPPSTGVCHSLTAGPEGLSYLVYGTREPGDSVYYADSGTVRLRGLGVAIPAVRDQR
jgi:uncharacterized cupin superfamily protein